MKINHLVYVVLVFGIFVSFVLSNISILNNKEQKYETSNNNELASSEVALQTKNIEKASNIEVAIATPETAPKEEVKTTIQTPIIETNQPVTVQPAIVYDNLTMEQLVTKLNKSLKSNLNNTGNIFAKYALEYNVDPYLAVAIALHETGCSYTCSSKVSKCNNVGGMKSGGQSKCPGTSYAYFDTLELGIKSFIVNLKENYYDKGLNTPELMNKKYASSSAWASKVNNYITKIKNA